MHTFTIDGRTYYIDTDNPEIIDIARQLVEQDAESFEDGYRFSADNLIETFELYEEIKQFLAE